MTDRLALFPLGTVLFPGLVLPLHLFEDRYRLLVRDLLARPEPRGIGVVGIELGHEVGEGAARRLAEVGCVAELTEVVPHPDGRYDIVTVGSRRFRLKEIDRTLPYLRGEVEFLPEEPGAEPESAARRARHQFRLYRQRLGMMGIGGASGPGSGPEGDEGAEGSGPDGLPADPVRLSHFIAASMVLDGHEKQRLLEAEDATLRLHAERELLARENRLLDVLPAVPAGQFLDGSFTSN
ncbi:LON peptidase substrate-binding domain-containing protein [Actinomadura xylanilytica]|uniref:LON peptidase substrate-binding domain-containing protein n=1 Tax=Actinomadura xylanilytica TaxID=887459 RepID=UPI00255AC918|nr:LON peptidase substrate-binding domain-containing protein [Actinomadura xylanilytica]MDL4770986.1 LON peptidase substrate-binding domain-containing protein [Actinomadura xylanilytica]